MDKISSIIRLKDFYKNKRILITGHNGFKGSWLSQTLLSFGSKICGISLPPDDESLFNILKLSTKLDNNLTDILDLSKCTEIVKRFRPEIIFHLAAQPIVKVSYEKPLETHLVNYIGTANILKLFSDSEFTRSAVFITTDKVYKNDDTGLPFSENDPFGGHDPYSASKAASEILIESWRLSFVNTKNKGLASARAGNVIGGGDFAKNRIIPDIFRAYYNNSYLELRNPNSVRPWQHVLESINGYLTLAKSLFESPDKYSKGYNFGPNKDDLLSVNQLTDFILSKINFNKDKLVFKNSIFHEAKTLTLNNELAAKDLNWLPKISSLESIQLTVDWYKYIDNNIRREVILNQIYRYFHE